MHALKHSSSSSLAPGHSVIQLEHVDVSQLGDLDQVVESAQEREKFDQS
jgi:hypothetical protein